MVQNVIQFLVKVQILSVLQILARKTKFRKINALPGKQSKQIRIESDYTRHNFISPAIRCGTGTLNVSAHHACCT